MSSARCNCSPHANGRTPSGNWSCKVRYRCTGHLREIRLGSPRTCRRALSRGTGFGKDSVEIESYVRGLARRRPDVVVTTLRLANLMGAGVDSHVTRYLSLQVVPRVMGFDARLQFLHPSDAVAALLLVTRRDVAGTFNVAAPDIVTLHQALRKMGRPTVGVPRVTAPLVATLVRQARLVDFSADQIDALTYGRAMDTSRFTSQTGFVPKFTSLAALEEFVGVSKVGLLSPERVDSALAAVRRVLETAAVRDG